MKNRLAGLMLLALLIGTGAVALAQGSLPTLAPGVYANLPAGTTYTHTLTDDSQHSIAGGTVGVPGSTADLAAPPGEWEVPAGSYYIDAGDKTEHEFTSAGTLTVPGGAATPTPTSTPTATPTPTASPTPSPTASPTATPTPSGSCSAGMFPTAYFAPDFEGPISRTFSDQFIVDDGTYIQTCFPAGSSAPSSGHPGGAQAELQIAAGPAEEYTLSYELEFPVGFTWVKGGKLPGLCGGNCPTGSSNGPGGFAMRFMWRADGAAEVLLSDATTTGDGTDLGRGTWDWLADGEFHPLSETVTMNTPGVANGSIVVDYNGVQVGDFTGLTLAAAGDTEEVNALMFSTFFGGHDSSWAPTSVQTIDFADFQVG